MSLHADMEDRFLGAVVTSCRKRRCSLGLSSLPARPTVIDGDKYCELTSHRGRMCDFIVFPRQTSLIAVVVEMKATLFDAGAAVEQLAGGAGVAESMTAGRDVSGFYALLLSTGVRHASQLKVLRSRRIRFRGKAYPIDQKRCGVELSDVLRS